MTEDFTDRQRAAYAALDNAIEDYRTAEHGRKEHYRKLRDEARLETLRADTEAVRFRKAEAA